MSVTLLTPPAAHSFSNDFITARFKCTDFLQQVGVKAVNEIDFTVLPAVNTAINIKYGSTSLTMTAKASAAVDGSGNTFDNTSLNSILEGFKANFTLSRDFDIILLGAKLRLVAKTAALGYNFVSGGGNATPGVAEIIKPNYRVFFRLFLENATHTGYEEIYQTYLDLVNGSAGVAVAQIGDKVHNKITADIDIHGFEIPGLTYVECNNTARKYYFQFAESFGDTIEVKKVSTSQTYNVIHGGLSFQGEASQTLSGLINPSTPPADRFLKQGSKLQYSRVDQPQFLYFYHTRATQNNAKLVTKRVFVDGTSDSVNTVSLNLEQNRKYAFNVSAGNIYNGTKQIDRYEVYLADNAGNRISEKQIYSIKRDGQPFLRYFLNWSSWGSLDSRCFTGVNQQSLEITSFIAEKILQPGYKVINGKSKVYGKSGTNKFASSTGFNDPGDIAFNQDFYLSNLQFRYIKNTILPIQVTSSSINNPSDKDFLYAQTFEYQYLFSNDQFTETDVQDDFSYLGSVYVPIPIQPILIVAGTPAIPSKNIIQQTIS